MSRPESDVVFGVLELRMSDVDASGVGRGYGAVPPGVRVRVRLDDARWVEGDRLTVLADVCFGAGAVEVVGTDAGAVADVVGHLRRAHSQFRAAEVEAARLVAGFASWGAV
ncbi:hypothetical protein [Actinokineospora iranica]|uniref:hypothetical protein n=1 Tax=Actinokineospora iranica TaxID=1271860 RepID=UPI001113B799|nr:hypothetical protein [Actinokineospora iranica]